MSKIRNCCEEVDSIKIEKSSLERYFAPFREHIVGLNKTFISPYGVKKIIYAD